MQRSIIFLFVFLFIIGTTASAYAFFEQGWQNVFCKITLFGSPNFLVCDNMKDTLTFQAGQDIAITLDNVTDTITIAATVEKIDENGTNLGTSGATVFRGEVSHIWNFARLAEGSNISLSENSTHVIISAAGSSGEANTGANVGSGIGQIFRDKTGVALNFKTLKAGTNISLQNNADDVTISSTTGATQLDDLTDVTLSGVLYGHILQFSGTQWQNTLFKSNSITCPGTDKISGYNNQTGQFTCSIDSSGSGSGPTVLSSSVTCSSTTTYCTIFTVPLTPSSGNMINFYLIAETNTNGAALQFRVRATNTGTLGTCTIKTPSTATAFTTDNIAVSTAPADDANTAWAAAANRPQAISIYCGVETNSSTQNLVLEYQMEVAATGTIHAGSNYIKTP